jgi:predicted MFS family arabinose efflux permease
MISSEDTATSSERSRSSRRCFKNPWWVVLAAVLGNLVGSGPLLQFAFGVFVKPLSQAFGTDRATISSAVLAAFAVTAVCTPAAGRLIDKRGVRAVVLPGIVLFALSIAALGLVPAAPLPFLVMYGIAGIFAAVQSSMPYTKAVACAFERQRGGSLGRALGVSMAGVGMGGALLPHVASALITGYGWRMAFVGLGVIVFLCAFPAVYLLMPESIPENPSSRQRVSGMSAREAMGTKSFWVLVVVFSLLVMACSGIIQHIPAILTDRGVSAQTATNAISVAGVFIIAGRLLAGYLLDRFFAPLVALIFILTPLVGLALLYFPALSPLAVVATVCVGLGLGAEVDLIAFFISRYLGMRSFGEIYGYLLAIFLFGAGLGPFLMGVSFSRTGSYGTAIVAFGVGLVVASIAILTIGPYRYQTSTKGAGH